MQGAYIIQGTTFALIPGLLATELDPTGAGDTFCGATLAYLLQKHHPIMAAASATARRAAMIAQVGPAALLSEAPPPEAPLDARVQVDVGAGAASGENSLHPLAPIIDYHNMRSCLRMGLIDVLDGELEAKLINRQVVSPAEEWAVRHPAYLTYEGVVTRSRRSLSAVNGLVFQNARQRCPEMTEPQCQSCPFDPVCAHRKAFFQPVLRTTFY